MKLESWVCTKQQAKRLKELGVAQEGYFIWGEQGVLTESWGVEGNEDIFYSAFTVAEFGAMFGKGTNAASLLYDAVQDQMNRSHSFTIVLSPQFLANCLIGLLETGRVTADEINQRLQNS
jgi:hypothetical protein